MAFRLLFEEVNNLLKTHMPPGIDWKIGQEGCDIQLRGLMVKVRIHKGISVAANSDTMPRKRLDPLRGALRDILTAARKGSTCSGIGFGVMLLRMAEEALWHIQDWSRSQQKSSSKSKNSQSEQDAGWDATLGDLQSVLSNPHGVNLLTVNDTAKFLLGKSISDILADLPHYLRVLHVEAVFRNDLVAKFTRKRMEMRNHLATLSAGELRQCVNTRLLHPNSHNSVEDLANILSTPRVTFHGAPRHFMHSIVRYGFVVPGQRIGKTNKENETLCGASFGVGIYSSPSIEFASTYARDTSNGEPGWRNPADVPGLRMVVCATLMGRPFRVSRDQARRKTGLMHAQADSHVNWDQNEYIVFDSAQIIPCYVLHLDYGSGLARRYFDAIANAQGSSFPAQEPEAKNEPDNSPGAKQAKKEALQAAAAKWFPYGFGPATGTNFVIEEIGETSDDEEEYGEFQEERVELENPYAQYNPFADEKKSWLDEFQTARTTKEEVKIK